MSKSLKIIMASVIVLVIGSGLLYTGIWIGRYSLNHFSIQWNNRGWGMMTGLGWSSCGGSTYSRGAGMMDGIIDTNKNFQTPSIHEVEEILDAYLEGAADPDLILSEIMVFDNHAYAQIQEKSTGIGAMEVLVDYQTKGIYPEQGPNMMWNLKYGHMAGVGNSRGTGMMGSGGLSGNQGTDLDQFDEMPVSVTEAVTAAQEYLNRYSSGYQADDHASMFYGYYTLHVLEGDEVIGMLSVNGYSGQVFYHDWHGELLEIDEH
jgi:hypothetical protein